MLHLLQQEVAQRLGVHVESVKNWERGASNPTTRQIPKVVEFLGYDPHRAPKTVLELIVHVRRRLGFTQERLAQTVGVNPVTVYRWENGRSVPSRDTIQRLRDLLGP